MPERTMTADMACPHCKGSGKLPYSGATLGERLACLRALRGLSLRQATAALDGAISNANLHHIETGKNTNPSVHMVAALAKLYGVTVDDLLCAPAGVREG